MPRTVCVRAWVPWCGDVVSGMSAPGPEAENLIPQFVCHVTATTVVDSDFVPLDVMYLVDVIIGTSAHPGVQVNRHTETRCIRD